MNELIGRMFGLRHFSMPFALTFLSHQLALSLGRGVTLPFSGNQLVIPKNLLLVGTMNPHDRSVSHVDAAFVRRFHHIELLPSREALESMLEKDGGLSAAQVEIIGNWFDAVQKMLPIDAPPNKTP